MSQTEATTSAPPHVLRSVTMAALIAAASTLGIACSADNPQPVTVSNTTGDVVTAATEGAAATTTSGTAAPDPPATTAQPVTVPAAISEDEIIDQYVGYWDARFAANTGTPDPQHPALAVYATGAQLDAVIAETRANLEAGYAFRARPDAIEFREVTVVSVSGGEAVVQECFVDDGLVIVSATGAVLNDTVATHNVRGVLRFVDGTWRVASTSLVQRWEGVAGCALAS